MRITQIHPHFVGEVTDLDLSKGLSEDMFAEVRAAIEEKAVLVFRNQQALDDDAQIAFSTRFGDLQKSITVHREDTVRRLKRPELSDISNVAEDGEKMEASDKRRQLQKPARLWHSDSSFRNPPGLYTFLAARIVPPEGGDTQFADMRAAYDALDQAMKDRIRGLEVVHSLGWSRFQADAPELSPVERENMPDTVQPLVRVHPATGRKSLYLSSHARDILGMSEAEGRALLAELTAHATQPEFVYSHHWKDGDLAMWDNRSTMHRATPFREDLYKRDMRRTTTADRVSAQAAS